MNENYYTMRLNEIMEWADQICVEWDGDESGRQEDRATQAQEIIEKAIDLQLLIEGMEEL